MFKIYTFLQKIGLQHLVNGGWTYYRVCKLNLVILTPKKIGFNRALLNMLQKVQQTFVLSIGHVHQYGRKRATTYKYCFWQVFE